MSSLISECKKRGNGFDIAFEEEIKQFIKQFNIEEDDSIKTGISYYLDKDKKKGTRIFKIGYSTKNRFFLEFDMIFNYSSIIENQNDIFVLLDKDRKELKAGRVQICYLSDDLEIAKKLIKANIESIK